LIKIYHADNYIYIYYSFPLVPNKTPLLSEAGLDNSNPHSYITVGAEALPNFIAQEFPFTWCYLCQEFKLTLQVVYICF